MTTIRPAPAQLVPVRRGHQSPNPDRVREGGTCRMGSRPRGRYTKPASASPSVHSSICSIRSDEYLDHAGTAADLLYGSFDRGCWTRSDTVGRSGSAPRLDADEADRYGGEGP